MGARLRELAILATARELDSQFEWAAHEAEALREGVPADLIETIRHRRPLDAIDPDDAAVIELAREIFTARKVGSATFARALALFGRKKLVELVALMGNYAATAALLTAFDMQLDPGQKPPLPPALAPEGAAALTMPPARASNRARTRKGREACRIRSRPRGDRAR